ncbi:flippase [Candidatus Binatia bacterium]|nr:flippase [Candidatus Binatia bacterium]
MATLRRLTSNSAVVVVGSALQRLLTLGTTLLLARGLGDEEFGVYAFVGAYMMLFGFLVDLGFERVIARELARDPQRVGVLMGTGFILRGAMSLGAAAVAVGVAWWLDFAAVTRWCIVLAAAGLPLSVESLVRAFFQSRYEMHYAYLLSLPGGVLFLALAGTILWLGGGLIGVFAAALVTGATIVVAMLWVALPHMQPVWRIDWSLIGYLWREAWELGVVIVIWLITMRIDQILLYWLRGPGEVGQYAVAVKITEALSVIPEAVTATTFPLLAAAIGSAPERVEYIYRLAMRYLILLALPVALAVWWWREALVRVLFGAGYVDGGSDALGVLAWWLFFSYTAAVYLGLMIVRSQQRLIAVISTAALAVNVGLNLILIPRWGASGAAVAMLTSSATSFVLFSIAADSRAAMRVCYGEAARPAAALAVGGLAAGLLAPYALGPVLAVPLYVAALVLIGGLGREDIAFARRLVVR